MGMHPDAQLANFFLSLLFSCVIGVERLNPSNKLFR
jgi:hypothetical protein